MSLHRAKLENAKRTLAAAYPRLAKKDRPRRCCLDRDGNHSENGKQEQYAQSCHRQVKQTFERVVHESAALTT
jgi:hypothetical protein